MAFFYINNSCYAIARHIPGPVAHCVAGWERIRFRYYTSRGMTLCLLTHDAWTPAPTMYGRLRPRCMGARAHDVWTPAPTMYGRPRPRCMGACAHDVWAPASTMYGRPRPRCMEACAHDVWAPAPTMYGRPRPRCMGACAHDVWGNGFNNMVRLRQA
jgi:hypothetical protein